MKLLSFVLLLSTVGACFATVTNSNEYCLDMNKLDSQCAFYTNQTVIPLIEYIQQLRSTIENNNNTCLIREKEIIELREKNIQNDAINNELKSQVDFYKQNIHDLPNNLKLIKCDSYIDDVTTKTKTIDDQNQKIVNLTSQVQADAVKLDNFDKQVKELGDKLKKCEELEAINKEKPSSCIPYGNYPGIHEIKVSTSPAFDVLCDSQTAGPGWTVIQQRINGKEDFYRNWTTYREGFGKFTGDFFLGLEKIHQMTKFQRHKLYIHMEEFNGSIFNAQYDNFKIAAEADNYRLISLGEFSGNVRVDYLRYHKNHQFSTFDRDHDAWKGENCAIVSHGGWWYNSCAACNLNGKYFDSAVKGAHSTSWTGSYSLKTVKMLIRPTKN